MDELILTATDTVFHDIDIKPQNNGNQSAGQRSAQGSSRGYRKGSSKGQGMGSRQGSSKGPRLGSSRNSFRNREMTEDDLMMFKEVPVPNVNSDDEWDTDLEDEGYGSVYRYTRNEDPKHVYQAACRRLNIVPASRFLKGVDTRVMNLNYQGLGPLGVRAVATGLVVDRSTTCVTMAGNFIGHDGVRCLCDMLGENDIINELDLSENDIDTYGIEVLSEMFRINDTVSKLSLSGNRVKGSDALHIANILTLPLVFRSGNLHGLKILDLSHNALGDEGAQILGHAIADNEVLTELNMSWNQIRKAGIICLAKGIGENNCLKKVDISTNGISNDGADVIGKALENNRTLEDLNLNSNRIGLAGITTLFASIAKNDNLRVIRLSNNPLTYQGPTAALQLLMQSETSVLEEIEIADACVPREFFRILEELQSIKPQFKVHIGGFMDSKDMFKAEIKTNQESWSKDPVLVFVKFIEEQRMHIVDMFKALDTDRSLMVSVDEFKSGITKAGCPLNDKQLDLVIKTLDTDENGEIDIEEFFEGHLKHKRRLDRHLNYGSRSVSRLSSERALQSELSSRPSSRNSKQSLDDTTGRFLDSRQSFAERPATQSEYTTESDRDSCTPSRLVINFDDGFLEPPRPSTTAKGYSNTEPLQDIIISVPKSLTVS